MNIARACRALFNKNYSTESTGKEEKAREEKYREEEALREAQKLVENFQPQNSGLGEG